jgi:hypothetical protein
MFKDRVMVTNLKPSMWQEHHRYAIQKFIEDPSLKLMIAYMDQYRGFVIEFALQLNFIEKDIVWPCHILKESWSIKSIHDS